METTGGVWKEEARCAISPPPPVNSILLLLLLLADVQWVARIHSECRTIVLIFVLCFVFFCFFLKGKKAVKHMLQSRRLNAGRSWYENIDWVLKPACTVTERWY